jgi:hypothetical protein
MSQAAAAAGAPSGAPAGEGHSSGAESNLPGFDPQQALSELKRARGETVKLATAFDSHKKEVAGDRELLQRLRTALNPEAPKGVDPVEHIQGEFDRFLEQAMELKQKGQQIPMTTQIALNFYQSQIENLKTIAELKKQVGELKGGVDRANHPDAPVNNIAYTQMDTFLQQSLDQLYGTAPAQTAVKRQMYNSVSETLAGHLKELQQKAPGEWDQLRRNPGKLQSKVNEVLRSIVPPKAMQMLEQEELENTPMTKGELWGAFNEAREQFANAKTEAERQEALKWQRLLRQDILDADKPKSRRRR